MISIVYKSSSESGVGTLLDNEKVFSEFLKDYYTMMLGSKKEFDDKPEDEIYQKTKFKSKSSKKLNDNTPSMKDFLKKLDKEFDDSKFTCYLSIFEEQEIHVSHLTKSSDFEYILMGITIIGCRQTLYNEAKKYE
ncbi:hypothetical protein C1645_821502 [Glomus cerebriforme]|uniref:Uncharacterized protein n=1 Tax=Glomus cerebriforme TaxID=658196 RepID=A0A397T0S7_9GLOM|nr:hypothetical protein C1645_821502 [Glomus cerebriforme]